MLLVALLTIVDDQAGHVMRVRPDGFPCETLPKKIPDRVDYHFPGEIPARRDLFISQHLKWGGCAAPGFIAYFLSHHPEIAKKPTLTANITVQSTSRKAPRSRCARDSFGGWEDIHAKTRGAASP